MNARFCLFLTLVGTLLVCVVVFRPLIVLMTCGYFLIGWLLFLIHASSRMQIDWPAMAATIICLTVLVAGVHRMLTWLARQREQRWELRWSAVAVAVMVLLFVNGIAMIGMTHQVGWLLAARQPLVEERHAVNHHDRSDWNLKSIGMATQNHHDIRQELPRSTVSTDGTPLHSWMTQILPFSMLMFEKPIDENLPWNHPRNAAEFRRFAPIYLSPRVGEYRSIDGYALSHYAGNVHVVGPGPPRNLSHVTDGTSQTMLAGEVAAEFRPWGDPRNYRDPSLGVNRFASGFANPDGQAVQFVFLDGSVRSFPKDTSPRVLRALATPRGGERVE